MPVWPCVEARVTYVCGHQSVSGRRGAKRSEQSEDETPAARDPPEGNTKGYCAPAITTPRAGHARIFRKQTGAIHQAIAAVQASRRSCLSSLSTPESEDIILSRFLAVKDRYSCHIKPFMQFLLDSHLMLNLEAVRAYFKYLNILPLAATTKCVRRQAVKARLRTTLASTDFNRQARLEMTFRALDRDSETKAPAFVVTGVAEDRIVTRDQFDRLVSGTSRRTALFLWFLYNTGCRAAEMCGARLDRSEDLGDMVRLTIIGKGNKERKVDIEKALFEAIRAEFISETYLFQTRGGKPFLPSYVSYEITKAARRIPVVEVTRTMRTWTRAGTHG